MSGNALDFQIKFFYYFTNELSLKITHNILPMNQFYVRTLLFASLLFGTATIRANTEVPADFKKIIERSEYFISKKNVYQSLNRKNGLTAAFNADGMSIAPQDSEQHWSFNLTVKGVFANGTSLYQSAAQPLASMHENTIQFNHDNNFMVEYVNDENGIRQNFIIQDPKKKLQQLTVQLQAPKEWRVEARNSTGVMFKYKEQLLSYNDLRVWDAHRKSLPAHFVIKDDQVQIQVDVKDAAYPVTIDPIVANGNPLNAKTVIKGNQQFAQLGYAAASGDVNGDGYSDVVIGAPGYSHGEANEGAVFVFYGSTRGINPTTYTLLEKNVENGRFGMYLASGGDVDGDGTDDIVVGAPFLAGDFDYSAGAIYVFYGVINGTVNTTPDIYNGVRYNGHFGISVAIAKDLNSDGYDDILVGANNANNGAGLVAVIYGNPWGILYTTTTEINPPANGYVFGVRVAGAGDVNNDTYGDILISDIDSVFVYHGSILGISNTPATRLGAPNNAAGFGLALAGGGDITGEGIDDIVIGARDDNSESGAFYIYKGSSNGVLTTPIDYIRSNVPNEHLGHHVAIAKDINGDGHSDVIVSGAGQDHWAITEPSEGTAYVYYGTSTGISHTPASTIVSNKSSSSLGSAATCAGDVNGDGFSDVLIGAQYYSNTQLYEGIALVFWGGAALVSTTRVAEIAPVTTTTASASIKTYPNPAVNSLSVQFEGFNAGSSTFIQIADSKGTLVQTVQAGSAERGNQTIDVSKLTPGLYIVTVQNGRNVFREKIIKQ